MTKLATRPVTPILNVPLLVWVDDPTFTHEEALTRAAAHIIKMDDELREHLIYMLQQDKAYAHTMCGQIYSGSILLHRVEELMGGVTC